MAKIYATVVINGEKLWTDVPPLWRKKTCAEIEARGYICNPDGTVSLPEPEPTPEVIEEAAAE